MKKVNTGTFQKVPSGYSAFVPANLPFEGIELDSEIISLLSKAERGIGELKSIELILPNANLLIQKYALKEALLSSQIEGIRTSLERVLQKDVIHKTMYKTISRMHKIAVLESEDKSDEAGYEATEMVKNLLQSGMISKDKVKEIILKYFGNIELKVNDVANILGRRDDSAREVKNCMEAMEYGINKITKENFPLCTRLLKKIQGILMHNVRGGESNKTPGEFRKSQNWIGGVSPSTAIFCPPTPEVMIEAISNLEKYLHKEDDLPDLIKCSLIHYQFGAIHPFCDGNGRTGRMLIILYLISKGILNSPILYLSLYFKQNRNDYYHHLSATSKNGNVYSWIKFFLFGIIAVSTQVTETTKAILELQKVDKSKIMAIKHSNEVIDYLMQNPVVEVKELQKHLKIAYNTANTVVQKLVSLEVLEQISEGKRNKKYVYRKYMNILEQGCENF